MFVSEDRTWHYETEVLQEAWRAIWSLMAGPSPEVFAGLFR